MNLDVRLIQVNERMVKHKLLVAVADWVQNCNGNMQVVLLKSTETVRMWGTMCARSVLNTLVHVYCCWTLFRLIHSCWRVVFLQSSRFLVSSFCVVGEQRKDDTTGWWGEQDDTERRMIQQNHVVNDTTRWQWKQHISRHNNTTMTRQIHTISCLLVYKTVESSKIFTFNTSFFMAASKSLHFIDISSKIILTYLVSFESLRTPL